MKILDGGGGRGGNANGGDAVAEEGVAAVDGADGGFVGVLGEVELASRATLLKAFMPGARASEIQRVAGLMAGFASLAMMD